MPDIPSVSGPRNACFKFNAEIVWLSNLANRGNPRKPNKFYSITGAIAVLVRHMQERSWEAKLVNFYPTYDTRV